jgi:hypothetical protein
MRILLSDGSGLTARQVAGRLAASGHRVEVLSPDPRCLCRFTRSVAGVRRVPPFGADPLAWLEAALAAYRHGRFDVLFPTQEQVGLLAAVPDRLRGAGVATAVPSFTALASVQDKASALRTLDALGIAQPPGAVGLRGWHHYPAYVKTPIGTASGGVRRVAGPEELTEAERGAADLVVQAAVDGPLAMCQSVFDHGTLVAFHANLRVAEGAGGGASHKASIDCPEARSSLGSLGAGLGWHGALSADMILSHDGPVVIDVNPRLVEPNNAWYAGVDLVGALVSLARGDTPAVQASGRPGVATHQTLLAVLGAAQRGTGRRGVAGALLDGWGHRGGRRGSREELTPLRGDPLAALPVVMASAATLVHPAWWSWFTSGSVGNYALTPEAWEVVRSLAADGGPAARRTS